MATRPLPEVGFLQISIFLILDKIWHLNLGTNLEVKLFEDAVRLAELYLEAQQKNLFKNEEDKFKFLSTNGMESSTGVNLVEETEATPGMAAFACSDDASACRLKILKICSCAGVPNEPMPVVGHSRSWLPEVAIFNDGGKRTYDQVQCLPSPRNGTNEQIDFQCFFSDPKTGIGPISSPMESFPKSHALTPMKETVV